MRRTLVAALAAVLLLSVEGCSSDDESPKAEKNAESPSPSATSTAKPKMKAARVETETIEDDALGHTISATKIVRNFPFPASMAGVEAGDAELVLVHVEAKAGDEFVALTDGDFRLATKKGDAEGAVSTTEAETEMRDAGYEPFGQVERGKNGSGWIAFMLEGATNGPLYLSYKRLEFDNGKIPEKIVTVPLTPAG
jgi:hypothetical protein